jgi:predicted secreted Zn-dependent protease
MIRKSLILLLFVTAAPLPVSAADGGIVVAKLDKGTGTRTSVSPVAIPSVTERYEYYEVQGDNAKDVRCDMDRRGCRWDDGRTYDSVTKWSMKWDYDYERSSGSCAARSFRTSVDILYRLPKWRPSDRAAQPLLVTWEHYVHDLTRHEQGHRDLAVESATELGWAVDALPPASTCADVDRNIQMLSHEFITRLNAQQKAYDQETGHGATQGALFR